LKVEGRRYDRETPMLDTEDRRAIAQAAVLVVTLVLILIIVAAAAGLAVAVFETVRGL
jgi:hypothetical protein